MSRKNSREDDDSYSQRVDLRKRGSERERIEDELNRRVFGQDRAVRRVVRALMPFITHTNDPKRPVGCFLLCGPSGVGKTYLAKQLAYVWIGSPDKGIDPSVYIDCAVLSLEHERTALTGAPPSYVGYGDPSPLEQLGLFDEVRRGLTRDQLNKYFASLEKRYGPKAIFIWDEGLIQKLQEITGSLGPPRAVLILDEIEKAHPNIHRQLLSILEEGTMRLANGRIVDFTGTLVILTSNIGSSEIRKFLTDDGRKLGYYTPPVKDRIQKVNGNDQAIYRKVMDAVKNYFSHMPELLGRIGKEGIIVFHTLKHDDYLKILDLMLGEVNELFNGKKGSPGVLSIEYTVPFKEFLLEEGFSPEYGARALRDVIKRFVRVPIANGMESGEIRKGDRILLDIEFREEDIDGKKVKRGETVISRSKRPKKLPPFDTISNEKNLTFDNIRKVLDEEAERLDAEIEEKIIKPLPRGRKPKKSDGDDLPPEDPGDNLPDPVDP